MSGLPGRERKEKVKRIISACALDETRGREEKGAGGRRRNKERRYTKSIQFSGGGDA